MSAAKIEGTRPIGRIETDRSMNMTRVQGEDTKPEIGVYCNLNYALRRGPEEG